MLLPYLDHFNKILPYFNLGFYAPSVEPNELIWASAAQLVFFF